MNGTTIEYQDDRQKDVSAEDTAAITEQVDEPNPSGRTYWRLTGGFAALALVVALSAAATGTVVHQLDISGSTQSATSATAAMRAAESASTSAWMTSSRSPSRT